ncbi:sensor histidine kinase [Adhaeribacter swui]|uniref:Sensor histidine kinase n=1 Tax=Adhaeribacter swui TaxID=2086471 RepID=A0A7G7GB67_9BACT|nr:sensor histidine kinase [Adhaeribacter swui]QNF34401.1 sensor histidine kinase [Adhaeribacter swui]
MINGLVSQISFSPVNFISSQGINFKKSIKLNFSLFYICRELLVISALGYFIKSAKQEQQLQRIHKQQLQAELTYLKVQLQPHFFFNTLNNIYALILQDSVQAAPLVARLAEMMRYIIYEASKPLVQLQQEIDFLKHYVAVEAVRYSGQTRILFDTQGIRDTAQIEPLLLLPLVENSFKHGLAEETNAGFVQIIISLMGKELFTEISNSKAGLVRNPPKGIGLENVLKRLDLLYPGRYTMEINNGETVYELRLTIQLKSHDTVPYSG